MMHRVVWAGNWLVERKKNVASQGAGGTLWQSSTVGLGGAKRTVRVA